MIYGAGFLVHNRLSKVSTLADAARNKSKLKGGRGKGRSAPGLSWCCRNHKHAGCTSMSCTCDCGHKGENRI